VVEAERRRSEAVPAQEAVEAAAKLRATRRWRQRCLVKSGLEAAYLLAYGALTPEEIAAVEATELCILTKRQKREARRAPVPKPFRVICFRWHGVELGATIQKDLSGSHQQAVTCRVAGWTGYSRETSWRKVVPLAAIPAQTHR
jgi:hypothetical protein